MQKGKFSAGAADFVRTLKNVDLPTFGTPTMPTFKLVPTRPISGFCSGSAFFGGISSKNRNLDFKTNQRGINFQIELEGLMRSRLAH